MYAKVIAWAHTLVIIYCHCETAGLHLEGLRPHYQKN